MADLLSQLPLGRSIRDMELPKAMPKAGSARTRRLGCWLFESIGWKVSGEIANHPRLIIVGAPHTSNWDFIVAMFLVMGVGVKFSYLMKKEAFFWPFKRLFMKLGGIPIDRSKGSEIIEQVKTWFDNNPNCWVALTPEGTRSKVERYKTGFIRMAQAVDAPLMLVAWHYPTKTIYFCEPPTLTRDVESDAEVIKQFYDQRFVGKHPSKH